MDFFNEVAQSVHQRWQRHHYDARYLPEIAAEVLAQRQPSRHVSVEDLCRWGVESGALPKQPNLKAEFGQPPLTVYADSRLYIEVLFWLDNTTAIHQHGFSGAFHILAGSSLHSAFSFEERVRVRESLLLGDITLDKVDRFVRGDVHPIPAGPDYIHSLFHLERPSATVVVRTYGLSEFRPQYSYLRPHIAIDEDSVLPDVKRQGELLGMLAAIDHPAFEELLGTWLRAADFESSCRVLWELTRQGALKGERRQEALEIVGTAHGQLVEYLGPVLAEEERAQQIFSRRRAATNADHRFFLALLLSSPSRADVLRLFEESYPDQQRAGLVFSWLQEINQRSAAPIPLGEVQQLFGSPGAT